VVGTPMLLGAWCEGVGYLAEQWGGGRVRGYMVRGVGSSIGGAWGDGGGWVRANRCRMTGLVVGVWGGGVSGVGGCGGGV